jgi:hypothetical protein
VTLIKENFINFIVDVYNMDGKYKNLDKRLQEQQSIYRKEKPPGLIKLIVEPADPMLGYDPCKIPGYVCIPEREYRRRDPILPMPIVEPDPNKENDGEYRLLPINYLDKSKRREYENFVEGYVYIPEWKATIPIKLPIIVPEEEIGKYEGIVPVEKPKPGRIPEGIYWFPELEPDWSHPGKYMLVPEKGYVWMPELKPKDLKK